MDDRTPSSPNSSYVIASENKLSEILERIKPENAAETIIGGPGMQLRVAMVHEKDAPPGRAEIHDTSDDVFYVYEGAAILTVGGKLVDPVETGPR